MTIPGPLQSRSYPIREHMREQVLTWRVQRIAWAGIALLCIAAAFGAFGGGPLSHAAVESADGRLRIEYERIERREAASLLRLRAAGLTGGGEAVVRYGDGFIGARSLRSVEPTPLRATRGPDGLVHTYAVPASGELDVAIEYRPRRIGPSRSVIGLAGSPDLAVHQLVLP